MIIKPHPEGSIEKLREVAVQSSLTELGQLTKCTLTNPDQLIFIFKVFSFVKSKNTFDKLLIKHKSHQCGASQSLFSSVE